MMLGESSFRPLSESHGVIPELNDVGYLPPGIHLASLDEIAVRFGQESELRRAQMESIRWLVEMAKKPGIRRMILNGSFVTDVFEPNDVDCALLVTEEFPVDWDAATDLDDGLPFVDLHMVEVNEFAILVQMIYATDRNSAPKGVIEVTL